MNRGVAAVMQQFLHAPMSLHCGKDPGWLRLLGTCLKRAIVASSALTSHAYSKFKVTCWS